MSEQLRNLHPLSSGFVAHPANDELLQMQYHEDMSEVTRIHAGKQPRRPHHIQEWAEHRGYRTQVELADALGADKSVVSRWYTGTSPGQDYQERLAELFQCDPEALFRLPEEDWLFRFFREKNREERERAIRILQNAFPEEKNGSDG